MRKQIGLAVRTWGLGLHRARPRESADIAARLVQWRAMPESLLTAALEARKHVGADVG